MGIILDISSDLMENYKRFRVASTGKKMQAVCREGFRGFLSIGDDGILYLSYEKNASTSGWRQIKLCESLRRKLTGTVEVNTFSAAVDRKTNKDYILAALKVNGKDRLFLSVNGDIADPDWTEVPLTEEMGSKLSVYRVAVSCYNDKVYLIVDFKMANQNTERYFICSNPGPAKGGLLTNISLGCNIVDGVCYMGSSYMYSPLSDKVDILCYSKLFSVFKYSAYLAKGLGFIQSEKQVEFDLLFKTMFGIASVIVAGVDIVFLIEAAKQPDGLEKKVFIIDTVSLLIDNLRNFGDFLLIVVEEPISHTVILAVRTVCAAGYAAMQIAEGSIILKEKSLLPEPA